MDTDKVPGLLWMSFRQLLLDWVEFEIKNKMDVISFLKFRYKLIFRVDHIEVNKTESHHTSKYVMGSLGTTNFNNDELQEGYSSKRINP